MHELYWNAANYVQISHKRQDLFSSHNHYKSLYIDIWFHQLWQVLEFYDNIFCTLFFIPYFLSQFPVIMLIYNYRIMNITMYVKQIFNILIIPSFMKTTHRPIHLLSVVPSFSFLLGFFHRTKTMMTKRKNKSFD